MLLNDNTDKTPQSAPNPSRRRDALFQTSPPVTSGDRVQDRLSAPPTARDHAVIVTLAQLRTLTTAQLASAFFAGVHPSAVRRRVRRLAALGWVVAMPSPRQAPDLSQQVTLTTKGWRWARDQLIGASRTTAWAPLVARILPTGRPLQRQDARRPTGVTSAHDREVTTLALAWHGQTRWPVRWLSTWERCLPPRIAGLLLPQPDYILILELATGPALILGEHDRTSDSRGRFARTKIQPYAALARLPRLCLELFGLPTFAVWVSVVDPIRLNPVRRVQQLAADARTAGMGQQMAFALAGEAVATPSLSIWRPAEAWVTAPRWTAPRASSCDRSQLE